MLTFIAETIKLSIFAVIVLTLSQVPVNNRRICDIIGQYTRPAMKWATVNLNFTGVHMNGHDKIPRKEIKNAKSGIEHPENEHPNVSGVLKSESD